MKFSTGHYASLWRISKDMSGFQRYSQIQLGEESVSWSDSRGAGGPSELHLELWLFGSFVVWKTKWTHRVF